MLDDIRNPGKIKTNDAKVTNFSILSTKTKEKLGIKRKMSDEIIDEFKIVGIQKLEQFEKLNLINVHITYTEINTKLIEYFNARYKYRFIINSLLFSSSVVQDTDVIFLLCNGLNDAKDSLINGKLYKTLSVVNIAEIESWSKLKGQSKWVNEILQDSENPMAAKHYAFAFETTSFWDLLNFQLTLADDEVNNIKFASNEKKLPALSFTIQVLKK